MGKIENGKAAGKDEITAKMIKGGDDRVMDWIWRLCNMAFENGVCLKIGGLLWLFYCIRVKERED